MNNGPPWLKPYIKSEPKKIPITSEERIAYLEERILKLEKELDRVDNKSVSGPW